MKISATMILAIVVCVASLLFSTAVARPYENQLNDKERQEILHYAAKIVRLVLGEDTPFVPGQEKRNSGMLDAVINMPDLFKAGRK